ncbi:MAG: ECF transporter S component [Lachnospiraceae bacterium]|nr:ECF transporter S component [Lachnospiraceae bacterium]
MNVQSRTRKITVTGMLSAIAFILMYIDFSVPFMPSFIKMDISELPALIGSFALGPILGVVICLIKNLLHLMRTTTGGVGELSNFILGASFVFTAGMIYKKNNTKKGALIGSVLGAAIMAVISIVTNYYIVYPIYTNFMPMDAIIAAYQAIFPAADSLLKCLIIFNMPFTFVKGMISVLITFLIYKRLSPILKGSEKF